MKPQRITRTGPSTAYSAKSQIVRPVAAKRSAATVTGFWILTVLLFAALSAQAQSIRFRSNPVRVTVGIGTGNSVLITNLLDLTDNVTNAIFDVTGLPAGATAVITDTASNLMSTAESDTNFFLFINATNVAEGLYDFSLNASGTDSSGNPATNHVRLSLQSAHVWNGTHLVSNNWATAANWIGGVPTSTSDVVFGNQGAQNNNGFTNVWIDTSQTISSLRFAQTFFTTNNAEDTATGIHTLTLASNVVLSVTGTKGFSFFRDTMDDLSNPVNSMGVNISGGPSSRLVISNNAANFAILISAQLFPTLNMGNLPVLSTFVSRMGIGDIQIYPNYRNYNDNNIYNDNPRRMTATVTLARTNFITATYKDPNNYTNEYTRSHAIMFINSEVFGTTAANNLNLGQSNVFLADSVCFQGANGQAFVQFSGANTSNNVAVFRGTNGTSRMSTFTISDEAGTNTASGNMKATVDFNGQGGTVDLLADRLYISRDRTLIISNNTPNIQGDLIIGRGVVDVNTAVLGFQEHSGKTNWFAIDNTQPNNRYLDYCQGRVQILNGGLFRVNGTLTLGYTADNNDEVAAQQYNTFGQVTIGGTNSMLTANTIIADGGSNFISPSLVARQNRITINNGGIVTVTNTIGAQPGLPLDTLEMGAGSTLNLFIVAGRTNAYVRTLTSSGATPGIIRILSLPTFPSYPTNIPIISYESASPFLAADMSAIGGTVQGYVINNSVNKTIDLFLTTNAPKTVTWVGNLSPNWNITTKNWVTTGGGATNFDLGDIVIFDDSSSVTNVSIEDVVVPNQTAAAGVSINNTNRDYTFSFGGGAISGTAKVVKQGAGRVTFNAAESGPITITAGTVVGSGSLGAATVYANSSLIYTGAISGGLNSTGTVVLATGSSMIGGPLTIRGGTFVNSGFVSSLVPNNTPVFTGGSLITNTSGGQIHIDAGANGNAWFCQAFSVLNNDGFLRNVRGRLNLGVNGAGDGAVLFGNGSIQDSDGGLTTGNDGRLAINQNSTWSPGPNPSGSIGTMNVGGRIDLNNVPATGFGTLIVDLDFSHPQTNDIVTADKWNNITGMILMNNIGAGSFAAGQVFTIFQNNNGINFENTLDVLGSTPIVWPPVPGPGLQWGMGRFRGFGALSVTNTPLVWDGGTGLWNTNDANWKLGNLYANNQGAMFDDTATGTTTVTLNTGVAPAGFIINTNVVIVPNTSTNFVILTNGPAFSPGIVVSNNALSYSIVGTGKITGITGLYKTGPGLLTILTTNDFMGNTFLVGGTTAIGHVNSLGIAGAGGPVSELFIDGATLRYLGTFNGSITRVTMLYPNGATFDVVSATNELTTAVMHGDGGLTKVGSGLLVVGQGGNNYAGTTVVSNGIVRISGNTASTNDIILSSGGLQFSGGTFTLNNRINVNASGSKLFSSANYISGGALSGSGSLTMTISNNTVFALNTNITAYSGTLSLGSSPGNLRFNTGTNNNNNRGSAAATFDLGTGSGSLSNFNGAGLIYDLGALAGGANTVLGGRTTNVGVGGTTYRIGGNSANSTFSGRIMNGQDTVNVVKIGSGALLLNGNSTYTGSTIVSNGVLGGSGSIASALTILSGATLSPGGSIGTFTINNNATLGGATVLELNQANSPANDKLVISGTITTTGGTLLVTNIGPNIRNNTKFQLFSQAVSGFATVTLPPTYVWTDNLSTDGSITLLSGGAPAVNTTPTNIVVDIINGNLVLSWPTDHIGWNLLSNSVSLLSTNMWFYVPGSELTNQQFLNLDATKTNVYFRMVLP